MMEQNNRNEDTQTLTDLLKQDEEMVLAQLSSDRSAERAAGILEKEADRLMYRAGTFDPEQAGAAQGMLQVLKNALPLVNSVSEVETWKKEPDPASAGRFSGIHVPPLAMGSGILGIVCVIAGMIGSSAFAGFTRLFQVLWLLAGCVLLLLAGYLTGRGRRKQGKDGHGKGDPDFSRQQTFLVDPAKVWHILQGTLLGVDHSLETARELARTKDMDQRTDAAGGMKKADLLFFSDLLENTYARRRQSPSDEALTEQVETIRYYLHERGIETEDYSQQSAKWFEMLPSRGAEVTIRPAFVKDGELIMKGVASGG